MIFTAQYPRKILSNGYISINIDGRWIKEHKFVVENFLKRSLNKNEVIHHINGIKSDNRIENLMLFKDSKAHAHFHRQIKQFGMTQPRRTEIKNRWKNYGNKNNNTQ